MAKPTSGHLSGDVTPSANLSGDSHYGVQLSGDQINIDDQTPILNEWDFEITGFPVDRPEEDELPLDFTYPGNVYIKIQKFDTNSSDLIEFRFYRFQIYRKGFENKTGYLTNEIGYSDPKDCIEAALNFVDENWDLIFNAYDQLNDDLLSAGFTQEELDRFYSNKPSFIPDEANMHEEWKYIQKKKCLSRKLLDRVENELVFKL